MHFTRLTKRQHAFVEAIKAGSTDKEAAIAAGYPEKVAIKNAKRLADHPKVLAAIAGLLPSDEEFAAKRRFDERPRVTRPLTVPEPPPSARDLSREYVIERLMAIAENRSGAVVVKERLQALNQLRQFLGPQTVQDKPVREKAAKVEAEIKAPAAPPSGSLASLFRGTIQAKH